MWRVSQKESLVLSTSSSIVCVLKYCGSASEAKRSRKDCSSRICPVALYPLLCPEVHGPQRKIEKRRSSIQCSV
ncbi:unnamed protein product [Haemonchus placei]|uniref:Secreted protein n=1 Tax=Haemonchus placei TaxID=6290 RepID=A0A158QRE9_HAEPC|nr:unnamed protein product [Haemonchus placei]